MKHKKESSLVFYLPGLILLLNTLAILISNHIR